MDNLQSERYIKEKVSIITPCYNGEKYITETIESVLSQTYSNWEMLIIDDGSTDNSKEIISKYILEDGRIKYIYQNNMGSAAARNHGIEIADGQYIALLDSDDLWDKDFLSKQIKFMKEKNATCVFCSYRKINEKSEEIMKPTIADCKITVKDMRVMNRIGCLSGLYNTAKFGKIYLHVELKSMRDDYAYWYDVVNKDGIAYGNQEILASYRVLSSSTTGNKKKLIKKQYGFYRSYLKENIFTSIINTLRWGFAGLKKFSK